MSIATQHTKKCTLTSAKLPNATNGALSFFEYYAFNMELATYRVDCKWPPCHIKE